MKTYKSSDLTHKRAEVFKAAREEGVIIEERRSNGEVINEYTLQVRYNGLKCRDDQKILNTTLSSPSSTRRKPYKFDGVGDAIHSD